MWSCPEGHPAHALCLCWELPFPRRHVCTGKLERAGFLFPWPTSCSLGPPLRAASSTAARGGLARRGAFLPQPRSLAARQHACRPCSPSLRCRRRGGWCSCATPTSSPSTAAPSSGPRAFCSWCAQCAACRLLCGTAAGAALRYRCWGCSATGGCAAAAAARCRRRPPLWLLCLSPLAIPPAFLPASPSMMRWRAACCLRAHARRTKQGTHPTHPLRASASCLTGAAPAASFPQELCEGRDLHSVLALTAAGSAYRLFGWYRRGRRVALEVGRALNYLHSKVGGQQWLGLTCVAAAVWWAAKERGRSPLHTRLHTPASPCPLPLCRTSFTWTSRAAT